MAAALHLLHLLRRGTRIMPEHLCLDHLHLRLVANRTPMQELSTLLLLLRHVLICVRQLVTGSQDHFAHETFVAKRTSVTEANVGFVLDAGEFVIYSHDWLMERGYPPAQLPARHQFSQQHLPYVNGEPICRNDAYTAATLGV